MNSFLLRRFTFCTKLCSCLLWIIALVAPAKPIHAQDLNGVAFKTVTAIDPVRQGTLSAVVFYPSLAATQPTRVGPYLINASPGAPAQPGLHPLVIFSHGSGGSLWGHHALASHLVAHGFLVAVVEHPGDNFRDSSGRGTPEVWYGRPAQIRSILDKLTTDPLWSNLIDRQRIGFFGFSAGGYTGLMLAGAQPDFRLVQQYCSMHSEDVSFCPFPTHPVAPKGLITSDVRIKAMVLAAPIGIVFDTPSLQTLKLPTFLMWADKDQVVVPAFNVEPVARSLPNLAGQEVIRGAGHFVFMSPCSDELSVIAPEICTDNIGIDRRTIHTKLNSVILDFFSNTLKR